MERLQLGTYKAIVRPGSKKSEVSFDERNRSFNISTKARAENNKANIEVIKLLSRATGKKVRIIRGYKGKEKVIALG